MTITINPWYVLIYVLVGCIIVGGLVRLAGEEPAPVRSAIAALLWPLLLVWLVITFLIDLIAGRL